LFAAALITCLISALFPQGLKVAGQAGFPTKEGFAVISMEVSHVLPLRVCSDIAAIDQTVVNSMAPTLTMTPALKELMTLRVTESISKAFVDKLKPVTPINVKLLDHPDHEFVVGLCLGLRDGFKIGYHRPHQPYFSKNLKTSCRKPLIVIYSTKSNKVTLLFQCQRQCEHFIRGIFATICTP
jgi:hypothetical protein